MTVLRYAAPVTVAAAAAGAVAAVGIRDPNVAGQYPTCPSVALFGVYCPGCGSLRGLHALVHGHLGEMVGHNVLLPFALVALVWGWLAWTARRTGWGHVRELPSSARMLYGLLAVIAVFTVARNLDVGPLHALAP